MQTWPEELSIDYAHALQRRPGLDLESFAALWLAADALAKLALEAGLEPADIPSLIMDAE
jgi:hypothetical protein